MPAPVAVIVDPYSAGALLAPELNARGWTCVAVQSDPNPASSFASSFRPNDFREIIVHEGSVDATAARLASWRPRHALAGCELGVALADAIGLRLGVAGNGPSRSAARRDKLLMAERASAQGLATPRQASLLTAAEASCWARSNGVWPLVVKPRASCGSDGVALCRDPDEVAQAADAILRKRNLLGLVNESALVQQWVEGVEYVVDTVSARGQHRPAGFWRYRRARSPAIGYSAMTLLPIEGSLQDELFAFTSKVLDSLEIHNGPGHTELILTAEGPVFLETGARMNGGLSAAMGRRCGGDCQLGLFVQSLVDPDAFLSQGPRAHDKHAANYFLCPGREGRLVGLPRLEDVKRLTSFFELSGSMRLDRPAPRVVGTVTLLHADASVVDEDLRRLAAMEQDGFYIIETS